MNLTEQIRRRKSLYAYMLLFWICTLTAFFAKDISIWILELLPAYCGFLAIFILLDKKVHFSLLLNFIFAIEIIVLTIGGVYTYAEVPFFSPNDWLGQTFGWERNNYDKLGHFMQGVTPYLACKELLIKRKMVKRSTLQVFLCVSVAMCISAVYELFEYVTMLISSDFADGFVASQGDPFDTQKDMLFALLGALFAACLSVGYRYKEEQENSSDSKKTDFYPNLKV